MADAALSWLRQQDGVKSVIVGASTPEQIEKNVKGVKLEQVKETLGTSWNIAHNRDTIVKHWISFSKKICSKACDVLYCIVCPSCLMFDPLFTERGSKADGRHAGVEGEVWKVSRHVGARVPNTVTHPVWGTRVVPLLELRPSLSPCRNLNIHNFLSTVKMSPVNRST